MQSQTTRKLRWQLEDIPYDRIDRDLIADQDLLFYLLASASFIEITTELFTRNLIDYFDGDTPLQTWLREGWLPEEMQHGRALRRYVTTVWPDFDWESAYQGFYADYEPFCRTELLGPTRALEMAGRCVVETGTSTLYTMLHRASPEPVLRELTAHIRTDEAYHYQHFYAHYRHYRAHEGTTRYQVLKTLIERVREIDHEDAYFAFKHAYLARHPARSFSTDVYRAFNQQTRRIARSCYPFRMAAHMALKPLGLPHALQRVAEPTVRLAAKHLLS